MTTAPNPHKGRTGFDRIAHAAGYSLQGLRAAWHTESAFRQEALLAAVMLPATCWVAASWAQAVALAGSVVLVLIVELLNSAIEATVDRISLEHHPLAKYAKDLGSAAVMLALLLCAGIWLSAIYLRWFAR
ncbi:MAG: diacylglycerol kinase [Burkholderiaceae bacterium]